MLPWRSSSSTVQLAIGTLSPKEAANSSAIGYSRRSPTTPPAPRAGSARACRGAPATREHRQPAERQRDRAPVRRAPAERALERRHRRDRDAARAHRDAAVQALRERRAARLADERAAGDPRERGAAAHHQAARDDERGLGRDQRRRRARAHDREAEHPGAHGPDAIREPPGRHLHRDVGGQQRRREDADHRERDAVGVGGLRGDAAQVRRAVARGQPQGEPAGDDALHRLGADPQPGSEK